MAEYLTGTDLASYLERDPSDTLENIAQRVNATIDEEWTNPTDPIPMWVVNLAWDVAVRAASNTRGVTSETKTFDDITLTNRYAQPVPGQTGVYLTDDEKLKLNATNQAVLGPPQSISVRMPGITTAPGRPVDEVVWPWRY